MQSIHHYTQNIFFHSHKQLKPQTGYVYTSLFTFPPFSTHPPNTRRVNNLNGLVSNQSLKVFLRTAMVGELRYVIIDTNKTDGQTKRLSFKKHTLPDCKMGHLRR